MDAWPSVLPSVGAGFAMELVAFDGVFFEGAFFLVGDGEEGKKFTDFFLGDPGAVAGDFPLADLSFFGESA